MVLAAFVCHSSPLSFPAFATLPAVCVTTGRDAGRHRRSHLSVDIDNDRVRLLFQATKILPHQLGPSYCKQLAPEVRPSVPDLRYLPWGRPRSAWWPVGTTVP